MAEERKKYPRPRFWRFIEDLRLMKQRSWAVARNTRVCNDETPKHWEKFKYYIDLAKVELLECETLEEDYEDGGDIML